MSHEVHDDWGFVPIWIVFAGSITVDDLETMLIVKFCVDDVS